MTMYILTHIKKAGIILGFNLKPIGFSPFNVEMKILTI